MDDFLVVILSLFAPFLLGIVSLAALNEWSSLRERRAEAEREHDIAVHRLIEDREDARFERLGRSLLRGIGTELRLVAQEALQRRAQRTFRRANRNAVEEGDLD